MVITHLPNVGFAAHVLYKHASCNALLICRIILSHRDPTVNDGHPSLARFMQPAMKYSGAHASKQHATGQTGEQEWRVRQMGTQCCPIHAACSSRKSSDKKRSLHLDTNPCMAVADALAQLQQPLMSTHKNKETTA
jgi:hypothetical protein